METRMVPSWISQPLSANPYGVRCLATARVLEANAAAGGSYFPTHSYEERVYAGVLSKIIGVYLGRPLEAWTYERITAELGEV